MISGSNGRAARRNVDGPPEAGAAPSSNDSHLNSSPYFRTPVSIADALQTLPDAPTSSSRGHGWSGVTLDLFASSPCLEFSAIARDHHIVCYCPTGSGRLVQSRAGATHQGLFSAGMSLVLPAGYDSTWHGDLPPSARLRIPVSLIDQAVGEVVRPGVAQFELRNVFETRDVTIERIAQILISELGRPEHPVQKLIADTMSCALAGHLLRSYNAFEFPEATVAQPLGRRQLERLTEFIEERLELPIGLDELAAIVNVSKFHFARIFKRSTGVTAIHYVEQCRINRAKAMIQHGNLSLAEIALRTGFADQSHFTRRFHRHVGCTPGAFARECGRRLNPARA